ncbi:glycosyltransferase [Candidatus Bathyarchaeota archaeon]|nr:glycosyltransferase [Candidatus Bathyarchaeota archaeon]
MIPEASATIMSTILSQLSSTQQLLLVLTTAVTVLLGLYAANWSLLTILSIKGRRPLPPPELKELPDVTIHLPLYNEKRVAARLIESCLRIDYPSGKLKIIVIDDSDDGTTEIAKSYQKNFPNILTVIHRDSRRGYKAGALQTALEQTTSDLVMIFDADYVPPPDLLRRVVPYIFLDENVAFVQTRSTYLNPGQSWITRAIALALDGYGIVDQRARYMASLLAHFSGTGGLFRRSAIQSVGGWTSDTLAEDLDLSIRLQLQGWRYVYLYNVTCPGEIPPFFNLIRRQQFRWAKGFAQCLRKHGRSIVGSGRMSLFQRFEALMLLGTYMVCPISVFGLLILIPYLTLFPLSFFLNGYWQTIFAPIASAFSALIYASPLLLYGTTVTELSSGRLKEYRRLTDILGLALLGLGTLLTNSKASIEGIVMKPSPYERTAKYGIAERGDQNV